MNLKENLQNKEKFKNRLDAGKHLNCNIKKCEYNENKFHFTIEKDGKTKMFIIDPSKKYADTKFAIIIEKNNLSETVANLPDEYFNIELAKLLVNKLIDVELKWIKYNEKNILVVSIC